MAVDPSSTAYLDTCIVSGLAKNDLASSEAATLLRILQARQTGKVKLVTSAVAKEELSRIPAQYRTPHSAIYLLLSNVPTVPTHLTQSRTTPSAIVRANWSEDPLYAQLRNLLPDAGDAEHTFQATKCGATFLLTVDRQSFLRHSGAVEQLCGVRLVTPAEFEQTILGST